MSKLLLFFLSIIIAVAGGLAGIFLAGIFNIPVEPLAVIAGSVGGGIASFIVNYWWFYRRKQ